MVEKKNIYTFANAKINGPFVYRLGLKIFILARGVRFPYGLLFKFKIVLVINLLCKIFKRLWQIISQHLKELDNLKKED